MKPSIVTAGRSFAPNASHGGKPMRPEKTAIIFIEYQNDFTTEGGKMYGALEEVMNKVNVVPNSKSLIIKAREKGITIVHAPIKFAEDMSNNPNKNLGILKACADNRLFLFGTWGSEYCPGMEPQPGDLVVSGKRGLDTFPGTDLEDLLLAHGIETLACCGFLANCCVESTIRTAFEKGFNVVGITDCAATTSFEAQKICTEVTWPMFSSTMAHQEFLDKVTQ